MAIIGLLQDIQVFPGVEESQIILFCSFRDDRSCGRQGQETVSLDQIESQFESADF